MNVHDRLIIALDYGSEREALAFVDLLDGPCSWYKVGLELYLRAGAQIVGSLTDRGHKVFLDLKLHDIPNTVAGAVRSAAGTGASLLTVHASGGEAMLHAAAEAAKEGPELLAVTVLTSMDASQLAGVGVNASPMDQVLRLGRMAMACGVAGLVCSPLEVEAVRAILGPAPTLVVPGIRPEGSDRGDQQRTGTPAQTLAAGASMLVIGRPITRANDPRAALAAILAQMEASQKVPAGTPDASTRDD